MKERGGHLGSDTNRRSDRMQGITSVCVVYARQEVKLQFPDFYYQNQEGSVWHIQMTLDLSPTPSMAGIWLSWWAGETTHILLTTKGGWSDVREHMLATGLLHNMTHACIHLKKEDR